VKKKDSSGRSALFSVSLLSGAVVILAVKGMIQPIFSSPLFQVGEIQMEWPVPQNVPPQRYKLTPATSIFRIDLNAIARVLQERHPMAEVEEVRRVLPDRLVAVMRLRKVLAQFRAGSGYYPISEEGTIVAPGQTAPWPHLPILLLEGMAGRNRYPVGERIQHPAFWGIAELLVTIHRQGRIAGHKVNSIRNQGQALVVTLDSGVEIRFWVNRLAAGWQRLADLVSQKRGILDEARYIDLRYGDPVIAAAAKKTKQP